MSRLSFGGHDGALRGGSRRGLGSLENFSSNTPARIWIAAPPRRLQRGLQILLASSTSASSAAPEAQVSASSIHHREKKHERHHSRKAHAPAEEEPDLRQWMERNGLPWCKVALKERPTRSPAEKPIHYVVASEDLQPGDIALQVPNTLIVTLERVLGDEVIAELLTTSKLSELACLALYLMYEKKQGRESFWYPFIRELDRQRGRGQAAVESPLLWSHEEVDEYLQGSPMKDIIKERGRGIEREYAELDTVWFMAGSLFKQYPFDIPTEAFSFQIFKQAFVAIQACVVHLQGVSLARRFALVPLGPPLLSYSSQCKAMLKAVDGHVQLEVDRPVKAGEQIYVWCGPQPNARLLLNYGFVDENNPYDRLTVEALLDRRDPLYQAKRAIVQRNEKLTIQTFQLYKGREREAVLDMLPYLRLAHVTDPQEVDSVTFAQGPVCGVSPANERAVLEQLTGYFQARLGSYKTTITEDEAILADPHTNPKKMVSTRLVRIEKKILLNAAAAVKELVDQIPIRESPAPDSGVYLPTIR